jgi:UDP-N-acetylglucosamine 2-epimerase (non-hydrolysing)
MSGKRFHVLVVFGTRPEAIKLAPVIRELRRSRDRFKTRVCITAQHRDLLDPILHWFRIPVHYDLNVMRPDQELCGLSARILDRFHAVLSPHRPDMVLVQGDTTTAMVASLAAFYHRVPVGHVEAGLRTLDRYSPFPEEINRRLVSHLADVHFAPTSWARINLLKEGIPRKRIFVTGNTVVDAFLETRARVLRRPPALAQLKGFKLEGRKLIVVTAHRRENFGPGLTSICRGLQRLAAQRDDIEIVFPVHPNPNVQSVVRPMLAGIDRIHLIDPLEYPQFVWLLSSAYLGLTDSGGIQEEMPSLRRPVLVMRKNTERPEGLQTGVCKLVGTSTEVIVRTVGQLLDDPQAYARFSRRRNPFGDGRAAQRIVATLKHVLTSAPRSDSRPVRALGKPPI